MGCCCACWEDREWGAGLLLSARGPGRGDGLAPGARSFVAALLRMTGRGRLCVRPYPPVCALGTSPEGGSKESGSRERGARNDRTGGRGPHPPQCAHWGTFRLAAVAVRGPASQRPAKRRGCGNTGLASSSALRCPKNRSGLRWSSGFSTAAVKEPCLLLPQAAAGLFPTGSARPQFPLQGRLAPGARSFVAALLRMTGARDDTSSVTALA